MIDWNLIVTQIGGTAVVVAAIAWLAKSLVTHRFSREVETHKANLSRDLETHKADLRREVDMALEQLRIHDHDRIQAFKRLYIFAEEIQNETFPLAEDREDGFVNVMKRCYWDKLQMDQIYFSSRVNEILEKFAGMYVCIHRPELIDETELETKRFLNEEVYELSRELAQSARDATASVRNDVR